VGVGLELLMEVIEVIETSDTYLGDSVDGGSQADGKI